MLDLRKAPSRKRLQALVTVIIAFFLISGSVAAAVTRNLTVTHAKQYTTKACVAAASWMELKQVGQTPPSQSSLYTEGLNYKSCNAGVDNGLDPRAWAYLLYLHTPAGRYYDHFTFTSAYAGTDAMIWQLFYYGEVAGALVNTGHHAFVLKGATVSCDPRVIGCNETISTVYVDDPWYDRSVNTPGSATCVGDDGQNYTCGKIGLSPGTAISYSMWTAYYYTPWSHQDCPTWDNKWVAVLRKASGGAPAAARSDLTVTTGKDPALAPSDLPVVGVERPAPIAPPVTVTAASASAIDLDAAFQEAKVRHGLVERDELAGALQGAHVRSVSHVRSLDDRFPDYLLATVAGKTGARGVALFLIKDDTLEFGAFVPSDAPMPKYPSVSPTEAARLVSATGVTPLSSPELVWTWSQESGSPFMPFYRVQTSEGTRFVTFGGEVIERVTAS